MALVAGVVAVSGGVVMLSTPAAQAQAGNCHPAYSSPCVPNDGQDVDCAGGGGNGPHYVQGPVILKQVGTDPFDLDGTPEDGRGCEVPGGTPSTNPGPAPTTPPSTGAPRPVAPTTKAPAKAPSAVKASPKFTG
jgi:hypothetical protein